jgi:hypothetical protein
MGDATARLRWARLHGISPEAKAGIDGRLIYDHQIGIQEPPSEGFFFCATSIRHVRVWHISDMPGRTDNVRS